MKVLIATNNPGKRREYAELLAGIDADGADVEWVLPDEVGVTLDVDETGETFAANAMLKATAYAQASGLLTLGDDSGLEVDALGGAPGVRTARYAGTGATDRDRYRKLLNELDGINPPERGARFVCAVAVCTPQGEVHTAEGELRGRIAFEPKGNNGFGYDPVFYVPGLRMTLAQVDSETKNRISHRAAALTAIRSTLEALIREQAGQGG